MKNRVLRLTDWLFLLILLLGGSSLAYGQSATGSLFVESVDDSGSPLPGVTVTLTGPGAAQVRISDEQGRVRFLGLAPGSGYMLVAELEGFSPIEIPDLEMVVGRNISLQLYHESAVVECSLGPTGVAPLLDDRKIATGVHLLNVELDRLPSPNDPWALLPRAVGVLVDRVNVGGNESGQQARFVSNGAPFMASSWVIDGVEINDPASRGASQTYFDLAAFEQVAIVTGGSDINALTSGAQLNLVTKRGTNSWRFSGRYLITDQSWQADSDINPVDLGQPGPWNGGTAQEPIVAGASIDNVDDYGFDVGGPLAEDRLWIWGSYGVQDIRVFRLGPGAPVPDNTDLENYALKLNGQLASNNSGVLFYHFGDKVKDGRGAGPTRPRETTYLQTGPTDIYKLEDTHIVSGNLYITGLVSYVGGGFALDPIGGLGTDPNLNVVQDQAGVYHNSYFGYSTERPQEQAKVNGNIFFNASQIGHELKFGVGYRWNEVSSLTSFPGQGLVGKAQFGSFFGPSGTDFLGWAYHDIFRSNKFDQWNVLLQDTITWGNVTLNAGIRYDLQQPARSDAPQPAARFADIPAFANVGGDLGFDWESISPRIGITFAFGQDRDTLLRVSYSRFADQLGTGFFSALGVNPVLIQYFYWRDDNGDNIIDQGSISLLPGLFGDRSSVPNRVGPGLDPALTDEIVLGVEHALRPEFVVGLQATFRQNRDAIVSDPFVIADGIQRPVARSDFEQVGTVQGTLPDGSTFSEPVYALRSGVVREAARGSLTRNSDLGSDYTGINLTVNKRLNNRWLLRGFLNYSDWAYQGRSARDIQDPTRGIGTVNGDQVLSQSNGSGTKNEVWISSRWSANVSGMYQVAPDRPWGFNLSADVHLREGYPIPYRTSISGRSRFTNSDGFARTVLVTRETDSFRNDDLVRVNARVEKEFTFSDFGLTVGVDAFNLLNNNDTLQTEGLVSSTYVDNNGVAVGSFNSTNADFIRETISPRIFRIGARFSWN